MKEYLYTTGVELGFILCNLFLVEEVWDMNI